MKKIIKNTVVFLSCLFLAGSVGFDIANPVYAVDQGDIDQANNEIDDTKQKIEDLKAEMNELSSNITDMQAYVTSLDNKLNDLSAQLIDCNNKIAAKQVEIDNKQQEITDKEAQITQTQKDLKAAQEREKEQYADMAKRIQYTYECGDETFLDMIFSSSDLSEMLGKTEYISNITAYDRRQLESIMETKNMIASYGVKLTKDKEVLSQQKAVLEGQKTELEALQTDLNNQQSYVDVVLAEKKNALNTLVDEKTNVELSKEMYEQELKDQKAVLEDLKARWEKEQEEAAKKGADADAEALKTLDEIGLNGGFMWPLNGYNLYTPSNPGGDNITSEYGGRIHPIYGDYRFHNGTDISGAGIYGQPIMAAYDGTVIMSQWYYGYGNCVQIQHGAGVVTLYAHCSSLAVTAGQTVKKGDVIGYVGSTGNSTGAHLHLSLFVKGSTVNPLDYFPVIRG